MTTFGHKQVFIQHSHGLQNWETYFRIQNYTSIYFLLGLFLDILCHNIYLIFITACTPEESPACHLYPTPMCLSKSLTISFSRHTSTITEPPTASRFRLCGGICLSIFSLLLGYCHRQERLYNHRRRIIEAYRNTTDHF